jgi:hypothetical protein
MGAVEFDASSSEAVTVRTVEAGTPSGVTVAGEKLHRAPAGSPEQLSSTGAANPFSGTMVTLVTLACPWTTVTESLATFTENAGVARLMVNEAELTELGLYPASVAMAFTVSEVETVSGEEYTAEFVVGVLPSVVKYIVAPGVDVLIPTVCAALYFPPATLKVGAATTGRLTIYFAELTELLVVPVEAANAFIVTVPLTSTGPVYKGELEVGLVPSIV